MKRDEFAKKIISEVEKTKKITKNNMEDSKQYGVGKNSLNECGSRQGVYFLYNSDDKIIYIGKVGTGKRTSLYQRMKGHGGGAHSQQSWYNEVEYGKYKIFDKLNDSEIEIIERVCILYNRNKHNYNDKFFNDNDLDVINKKINVANS